MPSQSLGGVVEGRTAEIASLADAGRRCDRVLIANTYHAVDDVEALLVAIARARRPR